MKIIEQCQICEAINHIYVYHPEALAWECWSCFNKWWLDEISKYEYMSMNDLSGVEADFKLISGDNTIFFVNGECGE